jgi:hypothetical protein
LNIFFTQKQEYISKDSADIFRFRIKKLTIDNLKYPLDNIKGIVNEDDSFTFKHKWSTLKTIGKPIYLTGSFCAEGKFTKVSVVLSANPLLVCIFYAVTILFIFELLGIETFDINNKGNVLLAYPLTATILFFLIRAYSNSLKERFEKLLQLNTNEKVKIPERWR